MIFFHHEWDEMFIEMEAFKYIQQGDVVVMKTGGDHPYYLLKMTLLPLFLKPNLK